MQAQTLNLVEIEEIAFNALRAAGTNEQAAQSLAIATAAMPQLSQPRPSLLRVDAAILIDQSASTIAKSEVMKHAREGRPIPVGWALDAEGNPTTDPNVGLKGSMAPSGGYKGVGVALMVEMMAAALTGATLGINASPFSGTVGGPPKTGQFFIAIDPGSSSGGGFTERMKALTDAVHSQDGAHLPGDGRKTKRAQAARQGVAVNVATLDRIKAITGAGPST